MGGWKFCSIDRNITLAKWCESCSVVSGSLQPHGLYNPWNSLGQNTGVGSLSLLQDLPNPGMEPRYPALRADCLPAKPQGSPKILEWVTYPFSRGSSQPRNGTRVSSIAGRFFTNWSIPWVLDSPWGCKELDVIEFLSLSHWRLGIHNVASFTLISGLS